MNFEPVAIKYEENDPWYEVYIQDKNSSLAVIVDIGVFRNGTTKQRLVDWKQQTNEGLDELKIKSIINNKSIIDKAQKIALNYLIDNGVLIQKEDGSVSHGYDIEQYDKMLSCIKMIESIIAYGGYGLSTDEITADSYLAKYISMFGRDKVKQWINEVKEDEKYFWCQLGRV